MDLDNFLKYRSHCPLCSNNLNLIFHSKKRQKIRKENGRTLIILPMDPINRRNEKLYHAGFSLSPNDNSLFVDFYDDKNQLIEIIPVSLLKKFHYFNHNLGSYKFYKICNICNKYYYESDYFDLDLPNSRVGKFHVSYEFFSMYKPIQDGYQCFKLLNNYDYDESTLHFYKSADQQTYPCNEKSMKLDLIKFTSKNETMNRLEKLILFS